MSHTKNALVTGGSRGIGLGIAQKLLEAGFKVAINGVRNESEVKETLDRLKGVGEVVYIQGDIGTETGRNEIVKGVNEKLGLLHVLVNNAGVAPRTRKDILEVTTEDYAYVMDINLKGSFFLTQAFAKKMIEARQKDASFEACIINMSSVSAEMASVNRAEYCLSKAGLSMLTKLLAVRMAEANIPVFEIRPGVIRSDMTAAVTEKYEKMMEEGLTLEKRLGEPEDIGKIVAAIAKGDIPYSTGQVFTPDGGLMVRRF